jgi:hypothetical protein
MGKNGVFRVAFQVFFFFFFFFDEKIEKKKKKKNVRFFWENFEFRFRKQKCKIEIKERALNLFRLFVYFAINFENSTFNEIPSDFFPRSKNSDFEI